MKSQRYGQRVEGMEEHREWYRVEILVAKTHGGA